MTPGADVSPEVMRRIRGREPIAIARHFARRPWAGRSANRRRAPVASAVAAGILLMVTVMFVLRLGDHGVRHRFRAGDSTMSSPTRDRAWQTACESEQAHDRAFNTGSPSSGASEPSTVAHNRRLADCEHEATARVSTTSSAHGDLELSRRMLDNPSERRLFLIKNGAMGRRNNRSPALSNARAGSGFSRSRCLKGS